MLSLAAAALAAVLTPIPAAVAADHTTTCVVSDRGATISQSVEPVYPVIARALGVKGSTLVAVDLAESGSVVNIAVRTSSGNPYLDREALRVTKAMVYAPEVHDCWPVAGSYAVEVDFAE